MSNEAHFSWDYFPRRLTAGEIMEPHMAFREFFYQYGFEDAKEYMADWFQSAFEDECILDQEIAELFIFYENVEKLVEAAHLLYQSVCGSDEKEGPARLEIDLDDSVALTEKRHYRLSPFDEDVFFGRFPRCLERAEFINPYLVIPGFFEFYSLPRWRDELKLWFDAAVSGYSLLGNCDEDSNLYLTAEYLKKLLEVAFFLSVRKYGKENPVESPVLVIPDPHAHKSGRGKKGRKVEADDDYDDDDDEE